MTEKLHWALLSTARINSALIRPLRMSPHNELTAVASRSEKSAKEYARKWKIPHYFTSYEAMLADPGIDVVYISLPNHLHAEWTIKALQAGKHVLCEKPMVLDPEDIGRIAEAAHQSDKVVMEAFMYRHHPQTLAVQDLVNSGILGDLRFLRGSFSFYLQGTDNIRLKSDMGGGALWDIGCYPVSYIRMVTGAVPNQVYAWQDLTAGGVDKTLLGQMTFSNGVFAQFDCSFAMNYFTYFEIRGTKANLQIFEPFKPERESHMLLSNHDGEKKYHFKVKDLYLFEVEDMAEAILMGKTPRLSLEETRQDIITLRALYESARDGHVVKVTL